MVVREKSVNRTNSDSVLYIKPKGNEAAAVLSSLKTAETKFQLEKIETLESKIDRISKAYEEQEERDLEIQQRRHVADQPDDDLRDFFEKGPKLDVKKYDLTPPTYSFQAEETQDVFKAEAGRKIKILFSTKDAKGHLFYEADNQVDVRIQAPSGNFVKKKIEDNLNGDHTVSFTSDIVGPHSVTITVNGQPLTGSPWSVEVSPYQYKLAFDIRVDERSFSRAIAVNKETNEIAVTQEELVLILSADHSLVRHFWLEEIILSMDFTINGSFVAILPSNFNRKLYLIDESGESIKEIGQEYLTWPMAVSVSHDGSIIVCDSSVKVFSPDGTKLLQSFSDSHLPNFPRFSVYHQDMFFVSYAWRDACIKTFSKYGVFLYDIDGEGSAEGGLTRPGRLAIDKFDNLIVSEEKTLKVFTVEGNFLYKIEVEHEENAIAASNTGNLYVVNEDCIRVFQ